MYGKITVGFGNPKFQRELNLVDFVQAYFKDNRIISISEIEDGSFICAVENPPSTDRNPQSTIWLSKESFIGLLTTAIIYFQVKDEDLSKMLEDVVINNEINYTFSDNLQPQNE